MYRRAASVALFLQAVLRAVPQAAPPETAAEPIVLKSTSHAVQLDVIVNDASGHPVHGLQKNAFVVTDNGQPREIRIFAGEIDANRTARPNATAVPPDVYSNRLSLRDSPIVTAIVIDAITRPEGLQKNNGIVGKARPGVWFAMVRSQTLDAIARMQPGEMMAIYAACPDLRIVQDYTSDPGRLAASLQAFVPPGLPDAAGHKQTEAIDALVPPMLSALRSVTGRMAEASGRKSVVWVSQAYGTELNLSAIGGETDSTVTAFNDANIPLYAVDTRFSPTCEPPARFPLDPSGGGPVYAEGTVRDLNCSQQPDISDEWMEYLAEATGGRAFSGDTVAAFEVLDAHGARKQGFYTSERTNGLVSDALHFAFEESRYAYQMGFYVPESELDGKLHVLKVTVPAKPKFELRYRSGYTASVNATAPPPAEELAPPDSLQKAAGPLNPDEVGIDAMIDVAAKNELRVSLALAPETVTRAADGAIVLDATFSQTDYAGKQLAQVQETVRAPSPETQSDMIRYTRTMKQSNGAVLLYIRIRDVATNRVGLIAVPIGKQ